MDNFGGTYKLQIMWTGAKKIEHIFLCNVLVDHKYGQNTKLKRLCLKKDNRSY